MSYILEIKRIKKAQRTNDPKYQENKIKQLQRHIRLAKENQRQKELESQQNTWKDIFIILTKKFESQMIKIEDFDRLLEEYNIFLSFDVIEQLFQVADKNKDYALNYEEFAKMINSEECNRIYSKSAKQKVKNKLRSLNPKSYQTIPITLNNLFLHLAQLINEEEQQRSSLNYDREDSQQEQLSNHLRFEQINDSLQVQDESYDQDQIQELIQKLKGKRDRLLSSSIISKSIDDQQSLPPLKFNKLELEDKIKSNNVTNNSIAPLTFDQQSRRRQKIKFPSLGNSILLNQQGGIQKKYNLNSNHEGIPLEILAKIRQPQKELKFFTERNSLSNSIQQSQVKSRIFDQSQL